MKLTPSQTETIIAYRLDQYPDAVVCHENGSLIDAAAFYGGMIIQATELWIATKLKEAKP